MKYAIVGCGLIGTKRAKALERGQLQIACDVDLKKAETLVRETGSGKALKDYADAVNDLSVNAVIVATMNSELTRVALKAIEARKHVLIEKPVGISSKEIEKLIKAAKKSKVCVRPGFNHRFHPALQKAHEIFRSGALGEMMFVRGRYGHGGRVGYDREWRANPKLAGGGELIDQGVHLIDLARWFLGDCVSTSGAAKTYFWDMKVDDNAFVCLETRRGQVAWLHVSCTEWKNLFSLEIYGKNAKLHAEGLGGSYGPERLHYYKMRPEMGPPEVEVFEFPQPDESWKVELKAFEADIQNQKNSEPGLEDALKVMNHVEALYRKNRF